MEEGAAVRPEESTTEQKVAELLESLSECGNNCGNLEITAFPCSGSELNNVSSTLSPKSQRHRNMALEFDDVSSQGIDGTQYPEDGQVEVSV